MGKIPKVATLLEERQKIEKEIEKLQKLCQHPQKSIKSVRERLDSPTMSIRYICDECYLIVGIPNNDNIQKFLKQ